MEVQQQGSNWKNAGGGVISTTYKPLEAVYPTMTTEALKELDVGRIAHRDAALFMWATDAHIPDALELYRAWGFRYVTVAFVWSKKTVNGKTVSNLAPWTLKNCELCLMGTRGGWFSTSRRTTSRSSWRS